MMILKKSDEKEEIQEMMECLQQDVHIYSNEKKEYVQLFITKIPSYSHVKENLCKISKRDILHLIHHQQDVCLRELSDRYHERHSGDTMQELHKLLHTTSHKKDSLQS